MKEKKLIELLTEQVELSKQILEELQKQSAPNTMHAAEHLVTDKVVEQEETQLDKMMRECYGLYKDGVIYDGNLQDYTDMFFKNFCTVDTKTLNVKSETHKNSIGKSFEANCIKYGLKSAKDEGAEKLKEAVSNLQQDFKDTNTPNMRPIEDWLNELPEPIRSKALDSVDKESELYESVKGQAGTYYDAIHLRNDADQRTKEGVDYWVNIYEQLEAGTQPSELVDPVDLDKSRQ